MTDAQFILLMVLIAVVFMATVIAIASAGQPQTSSALQPNKSTADCVEQYSLHEAPNDYGYLERLCIAKQIDRIEHRLNMTYSEDWP